MRNRAKRYYFPVDLAAVCSVAFILLLLYLSMKPYAPDGPVNIRLPETSGVACNINGLGNAIILIGQDKVFLQLPDTVRKDALMEMGRRHRITFSTADADRFYRKNYIGSALLNLKDDNHNADGIGIVGQSNDLAEWLEIARMEYRKIYGNNMIIAIKADKGTGYPLIKKVIAVLQDQNVNKFRFVTATKFDNND